MRIVAALTFIAALTFGAFVAQHHCALFAQEHGYTQAEFEDGRHIYQTSCTTCHGAFGDAVPGLDLGRGQFRTATTDDDLIHIIRTGIPGTSMPPFVFTDSQVAGVVAYIRNMAASPADLKVPTTTLGPGDAARGKIIFEGKGNCLSCHSTDGTGNITGPDLGAISAPRVGRTPAELQRKILNPTAYVRPENRSMRVVIKAGVTFTGKLLNQDTHSLQLLDYSTHRLTSFMKSDLKEYELVPTPMPSFKEQLTSQELSDLISYLISLKGTPP